MTGSITAWVRDHQREYVGMRSVALHDYVWCCVVMQLAVGHRAAHVRYSMSLVQAPLIVLALISFMAGGRFLDKSYGSST